MRKYTRALSLDICDYNNEVKCNLYDNKADVSGQATDVFVNFERNGWKEITFTIPSVCYSEDGEEENYRLNYLIADYRLRLKDDYGTDWYIISESKITHDANSKTVEVRAGHICQLLKGKNLNLELSEEEGNNVGTPSQLLKTILEGTGWYPAQEASKLDEMFKDDDGSLKYRTLSCSAKTGAFKMIEDMCELFEAKPEYWVSEVDNKRYVSIYPMNPFAKTREGEIPDKLLNPDSNIDILEIYYDKNAHTISKTENTDNIVTKFYAFGSYGDKNGLCDISTCKHEELRFVIDQNFDAGTEFEFTDSKNRTWFFKTEHNLTPSSHLVWSMLDFASVNYVWNEDEEYAYHTYIDPVDSPIVLSATKETRKNWVTSLFDFDYYIKVGLLTEAMFQEIAKNQRTMPQLYENAYEKSLAFVNAADELSSLMESQNGFAKLNVTSYANNGQDAPLRLMLTETEAYPEGICYRSDYSSRREKRFKWHVAEKLKDNGDPVTGSPSIVFIIHNTNPVTWEKIYVKAIYDQDGNIYVSTDDELKPKDFDYQLDYGYPMSLDLWVNKEDRVWHEDDRFYLFSTNSLTGNQLGVLLSEDETFERNLNAETKQSTIEHPVYFVDYRKPIPEPTDLVKNTESGYGWLYRYYSTWDPTQNADPYRLGKLYFCHGEKSDIVWYRAYVQKDAPVGQVGQYWYDPQYHKLYHRTESGWEYMDNYVDKNEITKKFVTVVNSCLERDMAYHGLYEKYTYHTGSVSQGNYAFRSPYNFFWTFTLDEATTNDLYFKEGYLFEEGNLDEYNNPKLVAKIARVLYESAVFPDEGSLSEVRFSAGSIDITTGEEKAEESKVRSNRIKVYEKVKYSYKGKEADIIYYDINGRYIDSEHLSTATTVTTPPYCSTVRIVKTKDEEGEAYEAYFRVKDYLTSMFISDKQYFILADASELEGENLLGINRLMKKFADDADMLYSQILPQQQAAQKLVDDTNNELTDYLGELIREGYWQDSNYVKGSEEKLYKDALENFEKLAQPETSYSFTFLDLYGSNLDNNFSADEQDVEWPDIKITDGVHLVDPDISTKCWAYMDRLCKCYDQPWKTALEINTQLTVMSQHEFTDVLAKIAEVAKETNANQSLYKRAALLSNSGLNASKLEGAIEANRTVLLGGSSTWHTDDKGAFIFEATDGSSALMITGGGMSVANTKDIYGEWEWRNAITGLGIVGDAITAGTINANLLSAHNITTSHISPEVGENLVISNNPTISGISATISLLPDSIISKVEEQATSNTFVSATDPTLNQENVINNGDYWIQPVTDTDEGGTEIIHNEYWYRENDSWVSVDDIPNVAKLSTQVIQNKNSITALANDVNGEGGIAATANEAKIWVNKYEGYFSEVEVDGNNVLAVATNPNGTSQISITGDQLTVGSDGKIIINAADSIQIGGSGEDAETLGDLLDTINGELETKGTMTSMVQEFILSDSQQLDPTTHHIVPHVIDNTTTPPTYSQWSTTAPEWTNNAYIWMRTAITSGDGTVSYSPTADGVCISGAMGQDGLPGTPGEPGESSYIHIRYSANADGTGFIDTPTASTIYLGVCTTNSSTAPTNKSEYTWTKYIGDNGVGIQSVVEKYAISQTTTAPADNMTGIYGWSDTPITTTETYPYLWNWESITDTNGTQKYSGKRIISKFSKDGQNGRGITSVVNYYLATNATSVTISNPDWSTSIQTVDATHKYLWNYEVINYTSGNPDTTTPCIIGNYAEDGTSVKIVGRLDNTSQLPQSYTGEIGDGYLINGELYIWSGSSWYSVGSIQGPKGDTGAAGKGISSIVTKYVWHNDGFNPPQTNNYSEDAWSGTASIWHSKDSTYGTGSSIPETRRGKLYISMTPDDEHTYYLWLWTRITYTDNTKDNDVRSEYGVNAFYARAWNADVVAQGIISGEWDTFLDSDVLDYGFKTVKVSDNPLRYRVTIGSRSDMVLASEGGLYIAKANTNPDNANASTSAIVMNDAGMALASSTTLTLDASDLILRVPNENNQTFTQYVNGEILSVVSRIPKTYKQATDPSTEEDEHHVLKNDMHDGDYWIYYDSSISGITLSGFVMHNYMIAKDVNAVSAATWFANTYGEPDWANTPCDWPKYVWIEDMWEPVTDSFEAEELRSFIDQTASNIALGVTAVGKVSTTKPNVEGSLIDIYQDHLDIASTGQINLSAGSTINLASSAGVAPGSISIGSFELLDEHNHVIDTYGKVDIEGSVINIGTENDTAVLNLVSGSELNIASGGNLNLVGGEIDINGGSLIMDSVGAVSLTGGSVLIGSIDENDNLVSGLLFENDTFTLVGADITVAADSFHLKTQTDANAVDISTYVGQLVTNIAGGSMNYFRQSDPLTDSSGTITRSTLKHGDTWTKPAADDPTTWGTVLGSGQNTHTWNDYKDMVWGEVLGCEVSLVWDATEPNVNDRKWVYVPDNLLIEEINDIYSTLTQTSTQFKSELKEANSVLRTEFYSLISQTARDIEMRVENAERKTRYIQDDGKITAEAFTENETKTMLTNAGITLDAEGKISLEAFSTHISEVLAAASMYVVVEDGKPKISLNASNFNGMKSSSINITPDRVDIKSGGIFTLNASNFKVSTNGTIISTAGQIGGFNIGINTLSSTVGGGGYVHMSSDGEWAFAAGNNVVSSAPFRVSATGEVYIQKLIVGNETINFENFLTGSDVDGFYNVCKISTDGHSLWVKDSSGTTHKITL